ncbi:MAG: hypothetical protein ACRDQZ_09250 [Mycobacteriales bacterium]
MFHIEGERLIKTSNGQAVPDDEPLFILRGRDKFALYTMIGYVELCVQFGVPQDRLDDLGKKVEQFRKFRAESDTVKLPGSTHGK